MGKGFINYPIPEDRNIAKGLIDAGASLVVGHHPHVIQGYEKYKNGLILYSLGNFIFPEQTKPQSLRWNKNERTGIIAVIDFSKTDIVSHTLVPVRLDKKNRLNILQNKERNSVIKRMDKWSERLMISEYEKHFEKCIKMMTVQRIFIGLIRNILRPRKKHFVITLKLLRQGLLGRKSFLN